MPKRTATRTRAAAVALAVAGVAMLGAAPDTGAAPDAPQVACGLYVPQSIAVSPPSPVPGQRLNVSGSAGASETVTLTVGQTGRAPVATATTSTNPAGRYQTQVALPTSTPPGRYHVQATSPTCGTATLTFVVRYADNRCSDYREAAVTRPFTSTWQLLGVFNWTKPVQVTLVPEAGGTSRVIRPSAPASPGMVFVYATETSWAPGWYTVSERGTGTPAPTNRVANCGRILVS